MIARTNDESGIDLNAALVPCDSGPGERLTDHSRACDPAPIRIAFRDAREFVLRSLSEFPAVFACVAWVTDLEILAVLATRRSAQVIVQKEDFLRPEAGTDWHGRVRAAYSRLQCPFTRYDEFPGFFRNMSCCSDPTIGAVRCVGVAGGRSAPRMHHKFAVLGDVAEANLEAGPVFVPRAVLTGSMNWTGTARRSIENVLRIDSEQAAQAYWGEWSVMAALSEPLDWTSEYVEPEWRIGT